MKQTVEGAARDYALSLAKIDKVAGAPVYETMNTTPIAIGSFKAGAEWQAKQSPWISIEERLPEDNDNIIIMCEHGAIFNGTYINGVWFCMDGYIHDTYNGVPIYTSMSSIPTLWEPIAWMPIPEFNE